MKQEAIAPELVKGQIDSIKIKFNNKINKKNQNDGLIVNPLFELKNS